MTITKNETSNTETVVTVTATPVGRKPRASRAASVTVETVTAPLLPLALDPFGLAQGETVTAEIVAAFIATAAGAEATRITSGIAAMIALYRAIKAETVPALDGKGTKEVQIVERYGKGLGLETAVRYLWLAAQETEQIAQARLRTMAVAKAIHGTQARGVGINAVRTALKACEDGTQETALVAALDSMTKVPTATRGPGTTASEKGGDVTTINSGDVEAWLTAVKPETVATFSAENVETMLAQTVRLAFERGLDVEGIVSETLALLTAEETVEV